MTGVTNDSLRRGKASHLGIRMVIRRPNLVGVAAKQCRGACSKAAAYDEAGMLWQRRALTSAQSDDPLLEQEFRADGRHRLAYRMVEVWLRDS